MHLSFASKTRITRIGLSQVIARLHFLFRGRDEPGNIFPGPNSPILTEELERASNVSIDVVPQPNENLGIKLNNCIPNGLIKGRWYELPTPLPWKKNFKGLKKNHHHRNSRTWKQSTFIERHRERENLGSALVGAGSKSNSGNKRLFCRTAWYSSYHDSSSSSSRRRRPPQLN